MPEDLPLLDAGALRLLAAGAPPAGCPACRPLACPGWETLSATDTSMLRRTGTLRDPRIDDPTVEELRGPGITTWSPEAPVAPRYFPYNRCDVWQCTQCARPFLRYTEHGGYYVEERIREVRPERVTDATKA